MRKSREIDLAMGHLHYEKSISVIEEGLRTLSAAPVQVDLPRPAQMGAQQSSGGFAGKLN